MMVVLVMIMIMIGKRRERAASNIKPEDGQVLIARESQQVPKW